MYKMTNTQKFAKQELDILAATVPDAIVTPFAKEILALKLYKKWMIGIGTSARVGKFNLLITECRYILVF